ncbi:TolC family protein [Bacteroidota bacterium]
MRIKLLLTVILSSCILATNAQNGNTNKFSLDEAIDYALINNKLIKNAKLDISISNETKKQSVAQGLPQADIAMDYINYFNYELEFSFGGGGEQYIPDFSLFDAGDMEIMNLLSGFMGSSEPSKIILKNSSSAKFQVNQLIYNGQYFVGIQTAKLAQKLSHQSLDKTKNDVVELVSVAYYIILLTEESLKVIDSNLENLQSTLEKSQAMVSAGILEQTDVDQIKMALSMLKNTKNSIQRGIELSYNSLRFQLGLEPDADFNLTDNLESLINSADLNKSLLAPFNYENNIDYQLMSTQEELSKKMVDMERASYFPSLVGFYSYTEKILRTDFDMNPKNLIGLNLSVPVFSSGLRNSKLQKAKIQLEKTRESKSMVVDQILLQEKQFRYNLKNAIDNYILQKENMNLAKKVYANIGHKYDQGIVSSLDLTQANDNYLNAQNNYMSSMMDVLQSKLALKKLLNKITNN